MNKWGPSPDWPETVRLPLIHSAIFRGKLVADDSRSLEKTALGNEKGVSWQPKLIHQHICIHREQA